MKETYFISDLHFFHENIIGFDKRPYKDIYEMEYDLVAKWNSQIKNTDITYILGDFCWSNKPETWARTLSKLKGKKCLITGNHDPNVYTNLNFYKEVNKLANGKGFEDVKPYLLLKNVSGYSCVLCHYPIFGYEQSYKYERFMLYGHVHNTREAEIIDKLILELKNSSINKFDNKGQLINVSCCRDYMNYTPQTLEYLIKVFDER